MLSRALPVCLAALALLLVPATARAGTFSIQGRTIVYAATAGQSDQIAGFAVNLTPGAATATPAIRFIRFGTTSIGPDAGCQVSDESDAIDCPTRDVDAVVLSLGDGDDLATISAGVTLPVTFSGGDGNDALFGGGGPDTFVGGTGNDNVIARDGRPESVDCGAGADTAITDDADTRTSCEEVEGDADGDGVRRPADCNDTNPAIHPGAVDVLDNGVDEDCSGTDAIEADRDHDGTPRPQDCNDSNPKVRPGLREVIGNSVDENCDGRIEPFPPITGSVSNAWERVGSRTRNVRLVTKRFPRRTAIQLRCSGRRCPFKVVRRRGRAVNLHGVFRGRALAPGTRIELRLTIPRRVGRVLRFTMRSPGGSPDVAFLCLPPGGRPQGC